MDIKYQVTSLELSKRLKELGVKQNGYFCWFKLLESSCHYSLSEQWGIDDKDRFEEISAFTSSELLEFMPSNFFQRKDIVRDNIVNCIGIDNSPYVFDVNEANARAKMLIYLIENGLIKND